MQPPNRALKARHYREIILSADRRFSRQNAELCANVSFDGLQPQHWEGMVNGGSRTSAPESTVASWKHIVCVNSYFCTRVHF